MKVWNVCKPINENRVFSDNEGHKWRVVYKAIINEYVLIDENNHTLVCNNNISNMEFVEDTTFNMEYQRILSQYSCLYQAFRMVVNKSFDSDYLLDIYSDCKILFNECSDKEYYDISKKLIKVLESIKEFYNKR